jgi:non-specific serine/threonine protein kinase
MVVLDNLEHVLDAAPVVADLLTHCSRLKIVATSRTRLGISGEHLYPVQPLTLESAMHIFAERAQAVNPAFALTAETTPVVEAICAHLDGLPLAIELAAARINVLPPRALLARLQHRLTLLTNGPRDAPARHRDMRDAIAWSHDLLSEAEQVLFRRLAVFVGGISLDAATVVAGDGRDILHLVAALNASSLLRPTESPNGEARFTLLETIHEFAQEQLAASGEEPVIRTRHADYFRSFAEKMMILAYGPDIRACHDLIELELDNSRAALTWALESNDAETGTRLAGALWRHWWYGQAATTRPWSERVQEGRSWLQRTLTHRDGVPVAALTEAFTGASIIANLCGDVAAALTFGEELLGRAETEGNRHASCAGHFLLGYIAGLHGDNETAKWRLKTALAFSPGIQSPRMLEATVLIYLGGTAVADGDLAEATTWLEQALAVFAEFDSLYGLTTASWVLGRAICELGGDLARATALLTRSLTGYMTQRDLGGVFASLVQLASIAARSGQPAQAERFLGAACRYPCHPDDHIRYDQVVATVRRRLGTTAFDETCADGNRLAWGNLLAEVENLAASLDAHPQDTPLDNEPWFGLSPREQEVLKLLTEGKTNRAIADRLFLSERTIETHVLHILNKLGVESRTAAATYAIRQGLV